MNRQPPVIEIVRLVAKQVEKLTLQHSNDEIEGGIRIAHNEEQRHFPVTHCVQLQFILRHNVPKLLDIEGGEAGAAAHQNAFECLACRHFEFDILLDSEVLRLLFRQIVKENIYGAFIGLVVLSGFAGVQQVQKRDEVPFLRLRLIPDVADQRGIIEAFRL